MVTRWRSSYYIRLVISYTVLALVLIGFTGGYLLNNANDMVMNEVAKDTNYSLQKVKSVVEENYLQSYEGVFNNQVFSLVSPRSEDVINYLIDATAQGNSSKIVSFIMNLSLIKEMTKGIEGITVYFKHGHYVVDDQRYYEGPANSSDFAFIQTLGSVPVQSWFIREKPGIDTSVLTYVYALPSRNNLTSIAGYLYLDIDIGYLTQTMELALNSPQTQLYVFDEHGTPIVGNEHYNEEMTIVKNAVNDMLSNEPAHGNITTRINDNVISVLSSNESAHTWTYAVVRPMESFLLSANKMKHQVWAACMAALLVGILIAFLLSRHFYMPLKKLLYSIRDLYNGPAQVTEGTEYNAIHHMLKFIDLNLLKMKDEVRIRQLAGLVTGQQTAASFDQMPAIPLECSYVAAYIVTEPEGGEALCYFIKERTSLASEVIKLSAAEWVLLGFIYEDINDTIASLKAELYALHAISDIPFAAGIGSIADSIDDIHRTYEDAKHAYRYTFLQGRTAIVLYEEVSVDKKPILSVELSYPILQNKMLAGNASEVEQWFNHSKAELSSQNISIDAIELACLRLGTIISQIANEQKLGGMFSALNIHDQMKHCTLDEMVLVLKEQAISIAEYMNESRNDNHAEKMNELKQFMKEHLAEDLSLESLAARVHLSSNYVSTLFGTITGESFSEYLNRVRLECAADMLVDQIKLTVAEVAVSVGYRNSQYFCTRFKAKYGITPLQYRNLERSKQVVLES
ncbi:MULTISPECIES: AraC family transcriptional regulator [unclassified Paenibacillus]|uniref:AraC family transcriptional regulator n=1 Tax=unclassified Paenibacillus TaxID=185978 RepID=UPI002F40C5E4